MAALLSLLEFFDHNFHLSITALFKDAKYDDDDDDDDDDDGDGGDDDEDDELLLWYG